MIKRNFILLISIILLLLIQVYSNNANTATQDYVVRNVDIDRSPKTILVGSFIGGRSHVKPMLDLAAVLIERGHNVILLTPGSYTPSSEYPTVKQISLGPEQTIIDSNFMKLNKDLNYKIFQRFIETGTKFYKPYFEKFLSISKEYDIDLFLCDFMFNDPCLDVAHILKKPIVTFGSFAPYMVPTSYKSDPLFNCAISLENESILERFKCNILIPLRISYMMYSVTNKFNNLKKQTHAEFGIMDKENFRPKANLTLIDTFFGFELPQSLPPNVQEIGPVLPKEYQPLTPELSNFINVHERVLYVAFGGRFYTTTENNCRLLQSFIEAINKNLVDGVIWPLSKTKKNEFCSTLNLNDGSQIQTLSILNNEHPHIYITDFAPQFAILNHNNTKLFFSHGGTGSVYESLYTGTPLLVMPLAGDQRGNAAKLKLCGVSLTLSKHDLDVYDILTKMEYLLRNENVRKNLKRMETLAKISSKRKYRAADLIEYILYSNSLNDKEEFLNEWIPADVRMGFIRGNNIDIYGIILGIVLGFFGGILWVILKLFRSILKISLSSVNDKSKNE